MKFSVGILCLFLFSFSSTLQAEDDIVTDIILINGIAELVDFNHDGEVLQRHLSIPDYFSSGRSHKRTLRESLAKTKVYGSTSSEEDYSETVVYSAPVECRQSLLKKRVEATPQLENTLSQEIMRHSMSIDFPVSHQSYNSALNDIAISFSLNPKALLRQRSLVDERFKRVALCFRSTSRTSKAIIEV